MPAAASDSSVAGAAGPTAPITPEESGIGLSVREPDGVAAITVPLDHKGVSLGIIRLFTDSPAPVESRERQRLLLSVGPPPRHVDRQGQDGRRVEDALDRP